MSAPTGDSISVRTQAPLRPAPRVLVLEDHDFQRRAAVRLLAGCGIQDVTEARSGDDALDACRDRHVDVLLCDLETPGMDGISFLRYVAQEQLARSIIIASGLEPTLVASVELMARSYGLDVLGVIEKPITQPLLRRLLERWGTREASIATAPLAKMTAEELEAGLRAEELIAYYQPKISLVDGSLVGVESLARWMHPQHGVLPPAAFITVAEGARLMPRLTDLMLEHGLAQSARWRDLGFRISVALNLSPMHLDDVTLPDRLAVRAQRHGVLAEDIVVEVTETAVAGNTPQALETLARLRLKGFGLAIDDYGTGYSSMQQLSRVPFTELKIDRVFVDGAAEKASLRAILESSLELARKLRLKSVAEGIEHLADWDLLKSLGCDVAQGYFAARPMPAEEILPWYSSWRERQGISGAGDQ